MSGLAVTALSIDSTSDLENPTWTPSRSVPHARTSSPNTTSLRPSSGKRTVTRKYAPSADCRCASAPCQLDVASIIYLLGRRSAVYSPGATSPLPTLRARVLPLLHVLTSPATKIWPCRQGDQRLSTMLFSSSRDPFRCRRFACAKPATSKWSVRRTWCKQLWKITSRQFGVS